MRALRVLCFASVVGLAACAGDASSVNEAANSLVDTDMGPQCVPGKPDPRACDPADTKKTTVCHIPPGNPANEHTICVGNEAVPAHLAHGDFLGSCCAKPMGGGATDGGVVATPATGAIP